MCEFLVREYALMREHLGTVVVRVHLLQVTPRLVPERSEITLYLREDDPEVLRYVRAYQMHERIRVDFHPASPVDASEEVW